MKVNLEKYYEKEMDWIGKVFVAFLDNNYNRPHRQELTKGILVIDKDGVANDNIVKKTKAGNTFPVITYNPKIKLSEQLNDEAKEAVVLLIPDIDKLIEDNKNELTELFEFINSDVEESRKYFLLATASKIIIDDKKIDISRAIKEKIVLKNLDDDQLTEIFLEQTKIRGLHFKEAINPKYLKAEIGRSPLSAINKIIDRIIITYGLDNLVEDNVYDAINEYELNNEKAMAKDRYVAIHEAGHAVMAYANKSRTLTCLTVSKEKGVCYYIQNDNSVVKYKDVINNINECLAGPIATKLVYQTGDVGSANDLETARSYAAFLVNRAGYKGVDKTLPCKDDRTRQCSEFKHYNNEKIIDRILRKQVRYVKKYMKKNIQTVIKLSDALYEKGRLNIKEIYEILDN